MPRHLLYATTNPGKIAEVRALLAPHSIDVLAPADLGLALDVPEPGTTLEANAAGKARAYLAALENHLTAAKRHLPSFPIQNGEKGSQVPNRAPSPSSNLDGEGDRGGEAVLQGRGERNMDFVVLSDDTGVGIDALNGEPGIHVRRWDGSARMSDEAIIAYCMERLRGVPLADRGAQFRTVFAVGIPGESSDQGADSYRIEYFDGTLRGMILEEPDPLRIPGFPFESIFFVPEWDMLLGHALQLPADQRAEFVTHRARALYNALPRLRELLDT